MHVCRGKKQFVVVYCPPRRTDIKQISLLTELQLLPCRADPAVMIRKVHELLCQERVE
jgi:hypothetical protein